GRLRCRLETYVSSAAAHRLAIYYAAHALHSRSSSATITERSTRCWVIESPARLPPPSDVGSKRRLLCWCGSLTAPVCPGAGMGTRHGSRGGGRRWGAPAAGAHRQPPHRGAHHQHRRHRLRLPLCCPCGSCCPCGPPRAGVLVPSPRRSGGFLPLE